MKINKRKGIFSKILVALVLFYMAVIGIWSLRILSHTGIDPSRTLSILFSFFGGELVLLLVKRIFAKEDTSMTKNQTVTAKKGGDENETDQ